MLVKRLLSKLGRTSANLHRNQKGLEGLEYLLIAALVIIATVAAWKALGGTIKGQTEAITKGVETTTNDAMTSGGFK